VPGTHRTRAHITGQLATVGAQIYAS